MFTRILPTTLPQIFCENLLYFQVIFKSMKIADDTFLATLSVNGLNIFPILHLAELYTTKIVMPFLVATLMALMG